MVDDVLRDGREALGGIYLIDRPSCVKDRDSCMATVGGLLGPLRRWDGQPQDASRVLTTSVLRGKDFGEQGGGEGVGRRQGGEESGC